MADHDLVWLSSPNYRTDAWSLSCLVSKHVSMAAQANSSATGVAVKEMMNNNEALASAAEVINVESLSVSSRGSVTDQDAAIDPANTGRSKRKRGNPWSENEHRQFLQGLQVHGKGKWKKISRDFVKTRNPVQVASHAQKFFDRHNSSKPKKRKSINDIITSFPAATIETPTPLNVLYNTDPPPSSSCNISTYQLPPLPDNNIFSQTQHFNYIFGNHDWLPSTTTDLDHVNKMQQLPCHPSYPPPMPMPMSMLQPPQPLLMWHEPVVITYPNVQVNAPLTNQDLTVPQVVDAMEPQFHPFQTTFPIIDQAVDHLSVPTLIDGDHIDLSVFDDLLPPNL